MWRLGLGLLVGLAWGCGDDDGVTPPIDGAVDVDGGRMDGAVPDDSTVGLDGATPGMCTEPAAIPPRFATVSGTCASRLAPCGGALDGDYALMSACFEVDTVAALGPLSGLCSTATVSTFGSDYSGTLTVSGDMATLSVSATVELRVTVPNECTGCRCADFEADARAAGMDLSCNPTCNGGICDCFIDVTASRDATGSVDTAAGDITLDSGETLGYCVDGSFVSLNERDSSDMTVAAFELASGEVPERCDGMDDDGDGTIDEAPVDCPSCSNVGACGGGFDATCTDGAWACTYRAAEYEADEASCDGIDNDCDAVTDEAASCERCDGIDNDGNGTVDDNLPDPPPCWSLGVCAAGSAATCEGADGFRCSYTSAAFEAEEQACDGQDNDCDGAVDESCCDPALAGIYYTTLRSSTASSVVRRMAFDGTSDTTLISGNGYSGLAVSPADDVMYVTQGLELLSASLDGSPATIVTTFVDRMDEILFDPADDVLFVRRASGSYVIRYDLTTGEELRMLDRGLGTLLALSGLDRRAKKIYFVRDPGGGARGELARADYDGTNVERLPGVELGWAMLDVGDGYLYLEDGSSGIISDTELSFNLFRANLDMTNPVEIGPVTVDRMTSSREYGFDPLLDDVYSLHLTLGSGRVNVIKRFGVDLAVFETLYTEPELSLTDVEVVHCSAP